MDSACLLRDVLGEGVFGGSGWLGFSTFILVGTWVFLSLVSTLREITDDEQEGEKEAEEFEEEGGENLELGEEEDDVVDEEDVSSGVSVPLFARRFFVGLRSRTGIDRPGSSFVCFPEFSSPPLSTKRL